MTKQPHDLSDSSMSRQHTLASVSAAVGLAAAALILHLLLSLEGPLAVALTLLLGLLLYDPLRNLILATFIQKAESQPANLTDKLHQCEHELSSSADLGPVARKLCETVEQALPGAKAHLFLDDDTRGGYANIHDRHSQFFETDSPLVTALRTAQRPVETGDNSSWPGGWQPPEDTADVLVPISRDQQLLGWLAVERRSRLSSSEADFLTSLAGIAAGRLEQARMLRRMESRVADLEMISQFSQYLNFTIAADDLLELTYTNYQRLLDVEHFRAYWRDQASGEVFSIFHVDSDERIPHKEGRRKLIEDRRILEVIETGQILSGTSEEGSSWIIMPLNAGAESLGALHTFYTEPGRKIPHRLEEILSVFSDRTAVALDRLQTRNTLELRAQQLEIINQVTFLWLPLWSSIRCSTSYSTRQSSCWTRKPALSCFPTKIPANWSFASCAVLTARVCWEHGCRSAPDWRERRPKPAGLCW